MIELNQLIPYIKKINNKEKKRDSKTDQMVYMVADLRVLVGFSLPAKNDILPVILGPMVSDDQSPPVLLVLAA